MSWHHDCPADEYSDTFEVDNFEPPIRKAYKQNKDIVCKYCGVDGLQWHSRYDHKANRTIWELYKKVPGEQSLIRLHKCKEV